MASATTRERGHGSGAVPNRTTEHSGWARRISVVRFLRDFQVFVGFPAAGVMNLGGLPNAANALQRLRHCTVRARLLRRTHAHAARVSFFVAKIPTLDQRWKDLPRRRGMALIGDLPGRDRYRATGSTMRQFGDLLPKRCVMPDREHIVGV